MDRTPGQRIKEKREQLGLSQSELANRLGISNSSVAHTEADRSDITYTRLLAYALALNCHVEELISDNYKNPLLENIERLKEEWKKEQMTKNVNFYEIGQRSECESMIQKGNISEIENLTPNERLIIERYRMLPQKDKAALLGQILTYEPSSERKEDTP